jgi:hypothetical protein
MKYSADRSTVIFRTIEDALRQLRQPGVIEGGGRLHYHRPCVSHPWRVIPNERFGIFKDGKPTW